MENNNTIYNLQVEESKTKDGEKEKQYTRLKVFRDVALFISFAAVLWTMVAFLNSPILYSDSNKYVEKDPLLKKISVMVKNGASLDIVKHTYEMRTMIRPSFFRRFEIERYYTDKTPLSIVLNDISANYLSVEPFEEDSIFFERLCIIIQENQYHNPFDNLEESQIPFFENIRVKSGNQYDRIQDDMVRIATEMSHKNQLVAKYLKRSNISFIISIAALVLTIILSLFQLLQGHRTKQQIVGLYSELNSDGICDVEES